MSAQEWLPISTAPKDGSAFLAFSPVDGIRTSRIEHGTWQGFPNHFGRLEQIAAAPSHWMPLPEPPK